jgi:hypothetical protein
MAEKILQTRIITKHADWETWQSSTLELKEGEIVLAKVTTTETDATGRIKEVPAFIAKVGNGATFANTPWMYAKAVDVYGWAKKANLDVADIPVLNLTDAALANVKAAIDAKVETSDFATYQGQIATALNNLTESVNTEKLRAEGQEALIRQEFAAADVNLGLRIDGVAGDIATLQGADVTLGNRIGAVEAKLTNVANVMDFIGTRTVTIDEETKAITVTPINDETFNKGDVVVDGNGKEYVYDGTTWHEFGYADSNAAAISGLQSRMGEAEGNIATLQGGLAQEIIDREQADTLLQQNVASTYETIANVNLVKEDVAELQGKVATLEGASANHISVGADNKMYLGTDVIIFDCGGAE